MGPVLRHLQLVTRMARTVGVDPAEAAAKGTLDQAEWAALVTRCRGCAWAEGCDRWLRATSDEGAAVPDGCPNRVRLADLAAR